MNPTEATNATKAAVLAMVNGMIGLLIAFGVNLTDVQTASVLTFVNSAFAIFLLVTYKRSPRRIPDDEPSPPPAP